LAIDHTFNMIILNFDLFLHSCSWRGQSCSSGNFTEILTSYGLCYTFNGKERNLPLIIESAGM
jgi:hypothetical protein